MFYFIIIIIPSLSTQHTRNWQLQSKNSVVVCNCRLRKMSIISEIFLILSFFQVAVKVIDKTKLDPVARGHLFQEVRCMKMVQHPNVVRLYEVIDTATKLYLILELGDGGDMYDCIMKHDGGLSEEVRATLYF